MVPAQVPDPVPVSQQSRNGTGPNEASTYGLDSPRRYSEVPQRVKASRQSHIRGVSVLPPREGAGERRFRLLLSLDTLTDPSSHTRRTGTVSGVELEVEEKDLQPLARLTGRQVMVHYLLWDKDVEASALQEENAELREEIENLRRKLRRVQDQLQYSVEAQVQDSRP